jgi:uncharacterized protein YigE (DUF2233 family)
MGNKRRFQIPAGGVIGMNGKRSTVLMAAMIAAFAILAISTNIAAQWRTLDTGLDFGRFQSSHYPQADSGMMVNILRINPKHYELRLLNASHPDQGAMHTAKDWAQKEGMAAVINAAMYQTDYRKSVSYMKTSAHVNNPRISKDKTILVFEPLQKNIPAVRIVDLECDDFEKAKTMYGSAVQSIRMLSCTGRNVWQQSEKRWSVTAIGIDKQNNLLFIQCTAPHSVHEFVNVLRGLPIEINRALYMEGGSPSQMYITTQKETMEFIGEFSTGGGKPVSAVELPNVLGVRKR